MINSGMDTLVWLRRQVEVDKPDAPLDMACQVPTDRGASCFEEVSQQVHGRCRHRGLACPDDPF